MSEFYVEKREITDGKNRMGLYGASELINRLQVENERFRKKDEKWAENSERYIRQMGQLQKENKQLRNLLADAIFRFQASIDMKKGEVPMGQFPSIVLTQLSEPDDVFCERVFKEHLADHLDNMEDFDVI